MSYCDPRSLFLTENKTVLQLAESAKKFAASNEPILFWGATGTGKDFWAKACHLMSARAQKPFLAINCAALPEDVAESELFGHAMGAYPGALEEKKGFFEQAAGGSVLLDEIGEMPARLQTKLLRFLNDGTFRRVGDDQEKSVDVRVMCSTQKNLQILVEEGSFRDDLYYRINVLPIHLPTLNERKNDIPLLAGAFINEYNQKHQTHFAALSDAVLTKLTQYHWPGNIRQLKNVLLLAMTNATQTVLTVDDMCLPQQEKLFGSSPFDIAEINEYATLDEMCKQFECAILQKYYHAFPSSRKLAKRLGLSHTTIANKLREYGITK